VNTTVRSTGLSPAIFASPVIHAIFISASLETDVYFHCETMVFDFLVMLVPNVPRNYPHARDRAKSSRKRLLTDFPLLEESSVIILERATLGDSILMLWKDASCFLHFLSIFFALIYEISITTTQNKKLERYLSRDPVSRNSLLIRVFSYLTLFLSCYRGNHSRDFIRATRRHVALARRD